MASYLGDYPGGASNRIEKFHRAVKSVIDQTYTNWELLIIADGCELTEKEASKYTDKRIKFFTIDKQPNFSGNVRQKGLDEATGDYVIYLDTDDYFTPEHIEDIAKRLNGDEWVYFDNNFNKVRLTYGVAITGAICHKRGLAEWRGCNGYGHDWFFIQRLMKHETKNIGMSGYVICHEPNGIDV